jgi:hypothetical protein
MIGRFLLCLSAAAYSVVFNLFDNAIAATATMDVGVVVTHNGGTASGSVVATHDYYEPALSSAPPGGKVPYTFGQVFRMGDVPSGSYASVKDNSGNPLPYQIDSISPAWPDGSMRHAVYTVMVPVTSGIAQQRLKLVLQSGAYSAASTPRSISEIAAHNYLIHYRGVKTHPGTSAPYTWATKGAHSGNFTCNVSAFIAAGQYAIRANGPVKLEARVYGQMSDDGGGTDPHLWCDDWIDVYSDPSNPANVMYVEHMARISQPFVNPSDGFTNPADSSTPDPNADFVIGQASLYDGATKLRDFADDNLPFTPAGVNPGASAGGYADGGSFTTPSGVPQIVTRTGYSVHNTGGGALPGGLSEGLIGFLEPHLNFTVFGMRPDEETNGYSPDYHLTDAGTTNFELVRLQHTAYYNGFFITADANGHAVLQGGTWTPPGGWLVQTNLDGTTNDNSPSSQKAYWQQTGLVPGYDLSLGAAVQSMDGALWNNPDEGPTYTQGGNGGFRTAIDAPGGDFDTDGLFAEWYARWLVRMGTTNWSATDYAVPWVAGLVTSTLPNTLMWRAPTGASLPRIAPLDYGPGAVGSENGSPYPSLGSPCPNDEWYAVNSGDIINSCFVLPEGINHSPWWVYGPFGFDFSDYHWPPSAIFEYLILGRDYFLDGLRGAAQRTMLQQAFAKNTTINGTKYYQSMLYNSANGQVNILPYAAAILGPASDPEMAYFQHVVAINNAYFTAVYNSLNSSQKAAGAILSNGNEDGFNTEYEDLAFALMFSATRNPGPAYILKARGTLTGGKFDVPGNPATAVGNGTWGVAPSIGGGGWYDTRLGGWSYPYNASIAPDPRRYYGNDQVGVGDPGLISLNTSGVFSYTAGWNIVGIANGDELLLIGPGSCSTSAGACPPELLAFGENYTFYITNLNTTTQTFQVSSACLTFGASGVCTEPDPAHVINRISTAVPSNVLNFSIRVRHDTGGLGGGSYSLLGAAALTEMVRTGISADATYGVSIPQAAAVLQARAPNSGNSLCTYAGYAAFMSARICDSMAVPVFPPLTGP